MAMPGILQQLAKSSPMMGQIKQMMSMVRMARDPQAALSQMMMNNPNMKQAMEIIQKYGGDPMRAMNAVAEQYGVNPQEIMDMLK